ncbi:zinc finger protein 507-like [Drosophila busckii]|uniref:zinc finger protein 507-like n=1 Tax=Drosophila busckii TaxID=30019 RepID=UPI00083ED0FD|nr:zinc finger protein 507-like [Drosophila busckii]
MDTKVVTYFLCGKCDYQSTRRYDLRRHQQQHNKVRDFDGIAYNCNQCSFVTKWKRNIKRHYQRHIHKEETSESETVESIMIEFLQPEVSSSADEDDAQHNDPSAMNELHLEQYVAAVETTDTEMLAAEVSDELVEEVETQEADDEAEKKRYQCQQCEYESNRMFDLRRHRMRHTRVKQIDGTAFTCSECSFVTKWKRNVVRHMRMHKRPQSSKYSSDFDEDEEEQYLEKPQAPNILPKEWEAISIDDIEITQHENNSRDKNVYTYSIQQKTS